MAGKLEGMDSFQDENVYKGVEKSNTLHSVLALLN